MFTWRRLRLIRGLVGSASAGLTSLLWLCTPLTGVGADIRRGLR